jgi:hypothetical protein
VGDTRGETICTFVYWKQSFKMKQLSIFNQTWYKHFLDEEEIKFIEMKVQILFKGG